MISVLDVAKYFLSKSILGTKKEITHLKLQKLIYYSQGYFLALNNGQPMFNERLEAWVHGPVCPTIYYEYRKYNFQAIPNSSESCVPSQYLKVLDSVWNAYGEFDGNELERMTHQEEPWIIARGQIPNWQASNDEITKLSMKEYFSNELFGAM